VGRARGADARQPATETAPVRPADTWHQTGKWTKTALQRHHQAQHKSLRDYHKYLGASGNGAIQIPRFPTQRSNASRGDQSGTCEGEAPPSQGSYTTRSWRPSADVSTLWSSIHCTDRALHPLNVEASTTMTASHSSFIEVPSTSLLVFQYISQQTMCHYAHSNQWD